MKLVPILALTLATIIATSDGANILVFIGMGSYSHRVPMQPWLDALADRGHNITILSGFPPKVPNPKITEVNPPKLLTWINTLMGGEFDVFKFRKNSQIIQAWFLLPILGIAGCEALYTDPEYVKWMKDPSNKFDIVVMDPLVNECAYGMAHHFKAKLIAFNTGQLYSWNLESHYGLADESSSIPDGMLHYPANMNFFQRAVNTLVPLVWKVYRELYFFPKLEEITKTGLGLNEIPSFAEIEANTSLVLVNNYWAPEFPRSLPPNVIPIGGIAWKEKASKPLPKNLQDHINKGKDGFIYVSFGTVAEFTKFDPQTRQNFVDMISKFPNIQFIWKSTFPIQEKLPSNVLVDKWLPQTDILTHPKIRLFITHGGLGGVYEAIFSQVPMICFPIFAEQEYNADLMELKGYGIKMELTEIHEPELTANIKKIIGNPSYKKQVEKVSKMFRDRPISALDSAVWWTEFILRHENTNEFIRPLSVHQSWWVRRQLDVWTFIILVAAVIISILFLFVKLILKMVCGGKPKKSGSSSSSKPKTRAKLD